MRLLAKIKAFAEASFHLDNPGGFRLIGAPGVGKTFLLQSLDDLFKDKKYQGTKPYLRVETGSEAGSNEVAENLLEALDYPFAKRSRRKDKRDMVIEAIKASGVRVVAFDEFQHCGEAGRDLRGYAVADLIKSIADHVQAAFVFLGTEAADKVFENNVQLRSRMPGREVLAPFKFDSYFCGVLKGFDTQLPMIEESGLHQQVFAEPIFKATQGSLRSLKNLLMWAVIAAATEGALRVEHGHLAKAFEHVWGHAAPVPNPFQ